MIDQIILDKFGNNVGYIILEYLRNIELLNTAYIGNDDEDGTTSYYYYKANELLSDESSAEEHEIEITQSMWSGEALSDS